MALPSVDSLLDAVGRLSPEDLDDFAVRFADWRQDATDDQTLIRAIRRRLASGDETYLRELTAKSEQSRLTASEQAEYRELAQKAERINLHRVQALAELVRRRGKPMRMVLKELGWEDDVHGA